MDKSVNCYLSGLLIHYYTPSVISKMSFEKTIAGIASFHDLYKKLLEEYLASSFGDIVFSQYILLPIMPRFPVSLRRMFWADYTAIFRFFSLPIAECLLPLNILLEGETDEEVLNMQWKALTLKGVNKKFSPLLYLISIHNCNSIIYSRDCKYRLRTRIIKSLEEAKKVNEVCTINPYFIYLFVYLFICFIQTFSFFFFYNRIYGRT